MNYLVLFVFLLSPIFCLSQDNIIKKDGSEIKAKVLQVESDLIKYKRHDNIDGPTYSIKKSSVFMIQYENGTKDVFDKKEEQPEEEKEEENVNEKKSTADETEGIKNHMFLNAGIRIGIGGSWTNYYSYPGFGLDFELGHVFYFAKRKMPKFLGVGLNCTWINTGGFIIPDLIAMPFTIQAGPQVSFQPAKDILLDLYVKFGLNITYTGNVGLFGPSGGRTYFSFIPELGLNFRHKALLVGFAVAFLPRIEWYTNNNYYDFTHLRVKIGVNLQKDYN